MATDGDEVRNRLHSALRILFLRHVPEVVEYLQLTARNVLLEALAIFHRNQMITPAPKDEYRQAQCGDALGQLTGLVLRKALRQRVAVAARASSTMTGKIRTRRMRMRMSDVSLKEKTVPRCLTFACQ